MRKQLPVLILILVAVPLLLFSFVSAQEESVDFSSYYIQSATAGSLTDNGDGTYLLSLENVPLITPWLIYSPEGRAGSYETRGLTDDWAFLEGVQRSAMLEIDGVTLFLTITNPTYDDLFYTATYQVTIDNMMAADPTITEPPTSFGRSTLFFSSDSVFEAQLAQAFIDRNKEGRPDAVRPPNSPQCCGAAGSGSVATPTPTKR